MFLVPPVVGVVRTPTGAREGAGVTRGPPAPVP
jgi:hypothetical protein